MADDNSTSPTPPQAPPLSISSIFIIAYLSLLVVTALSGNGLLVTVIIKRRLLQKVHYYFILSLASSDFLNALLKIPTTILGRFDRNWYPSYTVCYFTTPLGVLFGAASVLSLSAVAINRYLVISSPLDYSDRMPPVLAKIILAVIWFASFCLSDVARKGGHLSQRENLQGTLHIRSALLLSGLVAIRDYNSFNRYERVVRENFSHSAVSRVTNRLTESDHFSVPTNQEKTERLKSCRGVGRDWWNFYSLLVSFLCRTNCSQVRQR